MISHTWCNPVSVSDRKPRCRLVVNHLSALAGKTVHFGLHPFFNLRMTRLAEGGVSAPHPTKLLDGAEEFAPTPHPRPRERRLVSREENKREVARPPSRPPQMALAKASGDHGAPSLLFFTYEGHG